MAAQDLARLRQDMVVILRDLFHLRRYLRVVPDQPLNNQQCMLPIPQASQCLKMTTMSSLRQLMTRMKEITSTIPKRLNQPSQMTLMRRFSIMDLHQMVLKHDAVSDQLK